MKHCSWMTRPGLVLLLLVCLARALTEDELKHDIRPYAKAIGGICLVLGVWLAFVGKRVLRLYLACLGFLGGAILCYLALERIDQERSLGPHKEMIEAIAAFVAGLVGMGVGACVSHLAILALGALLGLLVVVGIQNIPGAEQYHTAMPLWALCVLVIAATMLLTFFLEPYTYIALTAIVGAFIAACGLDAFLQTGWNTQLQNFITNERHGAFEYTSRMHPIVITFACVCLLGFISQLYLLNRHHSYLAKNPQAQQTPYYPARNDIEEGRRGTRGGWQMPGRHWNEERKYQEQGTPAQLYAQ